MLGEPAFRRFFAAYATSLLGTSMAAVAVAFAVLDDGGTATDLGYVFAAGIVPQVLFMLAGGVIADRFGRWRAMMGADLARCLAQALLADLRAGWAEFRGRAWLVVSTVQFTLFNLFTWGPYLLLGPVLARDYLGGAGAWGAVLACYGAGSVLGGLLALGRRPRRPMVAATVATFGYALPGALLAAHADLPAVAAGALAAGAGSALGGVFATTAQQEQLPAGSLARVTAIQTVTSFAFGPLAFAAAGPAAAWFGAARVLGFGAIWCVLTAALVLAVPAVRQVRSGPAGPVTE